MFMSRRRMFAFITSLLFLLHVSRAEDNPQQCLAQDSSCNTVRLITAEELSSKIGQNGDEIWLAILGEVFDVSDGAEFYGNGEGYSFFTGKDASVTFVSGQFNEEGLKKPLDELQDNELRGIESWRLFYKTHDKYKFKGLLIGELYDSDGNPTPVLNRIREKLKKST